MESSTNYFRESVDSRKDDCVGHSWDNFSAHSVGVVGAWRGDGVGEKCDILSGVRSDDVKVVEAERNFSLFIC